MNNQQHTMDSSGVARDTQPRALNSALVEDALATREGQGWTAPSHDLSAAVVARIRASHGRKPLTAREPADSFVLKARLIPLPMLAGGGLAAAALLALAALVPFTLSPAGQDMRRGLNSGIGRGMNSGLVVHSPLAGSAAAPEQASMHASTPGQTSRPPTSSYASNEPLAEEVRRLGDDTRRAADAVLSTLQVGGKEPAPK